MPRKHFRRFLPDHDTIRANKYLAWLDSRGTWLSHPNLWHLNRRSVAGGFAIGLFAGMVPGPFQMLAAAALAIPLKKNLPVALVTTFYTNPITIAPLYVLAYGFGRLLLGASGRGRHRVAPPDWNWSDWIGSCEAMAHWMLSLGPPLMLGIFALAVVFAVVGYFAVMLGWRAYVVLAWRARAKRRAASRQAARA